MLNIYKGFEILPYDQWWEVWKDGDLMTVYLPDVESCTNWIDNWYLLQTENREVG